jgi:hypothetical protein
MSGLNLYTYAPNPTRFIDPLGLAGYSPADNAAGLNPEVNAYNKRQAEMERQKLNDKTRQWLCRSLQEKGEYLSPGQWLAGQRNQGFDKGDDSLAAAERFAMASEGVWDVIGDPFTKFYVQPVILSLQYMQKNVQMSFPSTQSILGRPGSKNPNLTEGWGFKGHWYYMNEYNTEQAVRAACHGG